MEYIQLKQNGVKRFGIRTADGKDTGKYIEIDIEDLEFPERAEKCTKKHLQNITELNNQKIIINKRQDHKDKGELYSDNEKALIKAIQEFYRKEEEALEEVKYSIALSLRDTYGINEVIFSIPNNENTKINV